MPRAATLRHLYTLLRNTAQVDGSRPLYLLFVHSCRLNFVKGGGGSTCSLRSQYMLLALDSSFSGIFTADKSPCLALAAELEECSKVCDVLLVGALCRL